MLRRWTRHWNPHRANLRLTFRSAVILTLVVTACGSSSTPRTGIVDRVIDGDTVDIAFGNDLERVRLIGIDTPEIGYEGAPDECWAQHAKQALQRLLPEGTEVRVLRDVVARDHYGRLLGYIFVNNDRFVNGELALNGHAAVLSIAPNESFSGEIQRAATTARNSNIGLWRACDSSAR